MVRMERVFLFFFGFFSFPGRIELRRIVSREDSFLFSSCIPLVFLLFYWRTGLGFLVELIRLIPCDYLKLYFLIEFLFNVQSFVFFLI